MKRDNCEIYCASISRNFPWTEITREFFHFQKFIRVIKFNSSFVTQSHEFFREIKCKASFVTHFHQFLRIFPWNQLQIKFFHSISRIFPWNVIQSKFCNSFSRFSREFNLKASCRISNRMAELISRKSFNHPTSNSKSQLRN